MKVENMENTGLRAAENNRCGLHRVKVVWHQSVGFGRWARKICPNVAKYLAGGWKTIRPATGRQSSAGLSMNESVVRYAY